MLFSRQVRPMFTYKSTYIFSTTLSYCSLLAIFLVRPHSFSPLQTLFNGFWSYRQTPSLYELLVCLMFLKFSVFSQPVSITLRKTSSARRLSEMRHLKILLALAENSSCACRKRDISISKRAERQRLSFSPFVCLKNIFEEFKCASSIIKLLGKHWRIPTHFLPHTVLLTTIGSVALKRARKMVVAAQKCG